MSMPKIDQKLDNFLEKIDKIHESFHEHSLSDAKNFAEIKGSLLELSTSFKEHQGDMKQYMAQIEPRVRSLEDFQLRFVAKFSILSAIAITIGSILGQLAISGLHKIIFKQ